MLIFTTVQCHTPILKSSSSHAHLNISHSMLVSACVILPQKFLMSTSSPWGAQTHYLLSNSIRYNHMRLIPVSAGIIEEGVCLVDKHVQCSY